MPLINAERLLENLHALRKFGEMGSGVVRLSLSDIDLDSRRWLQSQFVEAGLSAEIDGVGTLLARSPNPGPALLIGSHTDTQPTGGWLDGALGVVYGLEIATTLLSNPKTQRLAVDVASWIDEEGTFFGCLGSKSFCERISNEDIDAARDRDGHALVDALRAQGLADRARFSYQDREHIGYLEAHIEQGPYLEASQQRIGVVTDIVGSRNIQVVFTGQQNHAGTTPMSLRRDAVTALIQFADRLNKDFPKHVSDRTVWTMGRIEVTPNAPSIIPGEAIVHVQFRDPDEALLDRLQARVLALTEQANDDSIAARAIAQSDNAIGVSMDSNLMHHLSLSAEQHAPSAWVKMPSGAIHDAQVLAARMPAAMMFIPSIGGVSHAFEEDSKTDDIVLGCQVMADAVATFLEDRN